ncbi:DUF732 domain-containing protein [Mycobacterium sp.]|uniref:DUF732 domain-containing protein n=1 Tax=Mycobacterium sp. TaxID=1785 RepID=UPI0025DA9163|nr:DUF732 domain-containing protein [Mycobacterium sp.]
MTMAFVKPLLAAAAIAAFIGGPAPAHADDSAFLNALGQAGIEFPNPPAAVAAAREVCAYIADGHTSAQAARGLKNANPDLSMTHASHFVAIARATYCNQPIAAVDQTATGGEQSVTGGEQS